MALFDLPLPELERYRPDLPEPADFDDFWRRTLDAAGRHPVLIDVTRVRTGLTRLETFDVTFAGFDGQPIRAWYTRPAGTEGSELPAVVEYLGYGRGRGVPFERLLWPSAGYAHLLMDSRGQGAQHGNGGHTPDPVGSDPAAPGVLTRGLRDPDTAYLRRIYTDAARAVDAVAELDGVDADRIAVVGNSQGGGLAIAAAGLNPRARALLATVPFLCHIRRCLDITDAQPYAEFVQYLSVQREATDEIHRSLAYFDAVQLARRVRVPAQFAVGLRDTVCPPSGVFAAYNLLGTRTDAAPAAENEIAVYPYNHHEHGDGHHVRRQLDWLAGIFEQRLGSAAA